MPQTARELAIFLRVTYTKLTVIQDTAILEGNAIPTDEMIFYSEGMKDTVELAEALAGLRPFPPEVEVPEGFYDN